MIEPFPLALLLSVFVFVGLRFIIRLKSSTLISETLSILAFFFLLPMLGVQIMSIIGA
ncbi:MAG: hypothetical protein Ct9H90mP6_02070 [Gammaproteobacteria bacterium]|nr:MAG: hypothetical protein Ct9H90mP6_02070 [Gammaproteobacteria bacterium]